MPRARRPASPAPFGQFLQRQLADTDVSPADFAVQAGLSVSHVYQLLRGLDRDPRYRASAVGRMKLIIAAGPDDALKELEHTLKEIDVPVPAK